MTVVVTVVTMLLTWCPGRLRTTQALHPNRFFLTSQPSSGRRAWSCSLWCTWAGQPGAGSKAQTEGSWQGAAFSQFPRLVSSLGAPGSWPRRH